MELRLQGTQMVRRTIESLSFDGEVNSVALSWSEICRQPLQVLISIATAGSRCLFEVFEAVRL